MKFIYEKLKQLTIIAEEIEEEASNDMTTTTTMEYLYDNMRTTRSQIRMYSKSLFYNDNNNNNKERSFFDFLK